MRIAFLGVRFYTNRESLPVPDCWCGDDVSGDSGTVPAVFPDDSVPQLYKTSDPHRKGFYATQQRPYILKPYITIASSLSARI